MSNIRIRSRQWPKGMEGLFIYMAFLLLAASFLPSILIGQESYPFLLGIGVLAAWRYSWGLLNFLRSCLYRYYVFPRWRRMITAKEENLLPSKIYILITVFRIGTETASRSIRSVVEEAISSGIPSTIIASIVEAQDEYLFEEIFSSYEIPDHVELKIVRVSGTGKRTGLAYGFKAISRDMPPPDALVVVMDGDTVLLPDSLRKSVPFFKFRPRLGALTTDEIAEVHGSRIMKEWHDLRFAQRHLLMSSISLSRRVMTLTGRMSIFRADIVTDPEFIKHITEDQIDHWRLGRFKFLTGDDKSSLYWVMKKEYEQLYLPDVEVLTLEDPPASNFFKAGSQLMFRWFGNMLRTNQRILELGPQKMPPYVWWSFLDQRLSMWTSLAGPVFAIMLSFKYGVVFFYYYIIWIGFIRLIMTLMLLSARGTTSWRYPFLLYYNQVYGSLLKTWIMFRLDVQSWTRQKTKMRRNLSKGQYMWNKWTSHLTHAAALMAFICAIGFASDMLQVPHGTIRAIAGVANYSLLPR